MTSITLSVVERPPTPLSVSINSVVPLTTAFTPAPACSSSVWESIDSTQGTITCTPSLAPSLTSQCYPSDFNETYTRLYSPGVCPQGYAAAASWASSAASDIHHTSLCCPRGMSWLQVVSSCSEILPTGTGTMVVASNETYFVTAPFTAYAPAIAVAWATSDLTLFSPASLPLLTTASSTSAAASATAATAGSATSMASSTATTATGAAQTSTTPDPGLSVGAKAGIGVGAALGGLLCLALIAWLVLWRKRSSGKKAMPEAEGKAELPGDGIERKAPNVSELGPNGEIVESGAKERPPELGDNVRYELEGNWQGHEMQGARAHNAH